MKKEYVPVLLILFFVVFSLWPTVYEWRNRYRVRPVRAFELVHNFYTDYNFYLSRIRQGREGGLLVREKYTSEPHAGSLVQIFYLLIGRAAAWNRVPWPRMGDAYQAARIVLSFSLAGLIWWFVRSLVKGFHRQIISFVVVMTAGTWPILVKVGAGWRLGGYMPWWSVMDSLQRITFVPHILAGQLFIVFLVGILSRPDIIRRPGNPVFLGLLALILGLVFPPGLVFVWTVLAGLSVIEVLLFRQHRAASGQAGYIRAILIPRLWVILLSAPALAYLQLTLAVYPWKRLIDYALLGLTPFNSIEYAKAVGPVLPLGIAGLVLAWKRRDETLKPAVAWVAAWLFLMIVFQFIPQESPLRFTEMAPHIPLGILSAYVLFWLTQSGFRFRGFLRSALRLTAHVLLIALVLSGLLTMYSSWLWQRDFIDHKMAADYPLVPTGSYVMYPLRDMLDAMIFIQDHTSREEVILSGKTSGNYLPVYSGNTVYIGHAGTVNLEEKERQVQAFFSATMSQSAAREWLARRGLRYILFGPEEREIGGVSELRQAYPFLAELYAGPYFTVYRVQ